jgi:large subunit ribosomal protein L25
MSSEKAVLKAEKRELSTKGDIRKLRLAGKVPAIIYGKNKPQQMIAVEGRELNMAYNKGKFFSKTIFLELDGKEVEVIPQDIQFEPVKDKALHADFIRVDKDSVVKISVPVKFINKEKSPGLKRGGVLNMVRRSIEVYCTVDNIPEFFTADVGKLKIKDNVKYSDLKGLENVTPLIDDRDFTVATIAGRVTEAEKEAQAEEDAAGAEDKSEEGKSD